MTYPVLRPAHFPEDAEAVRRLFREYEAELGVDLCFQGFEEELASLPGRYSAPLGGIWLATDFDGAYGCGAFRPHGSGRCEMKRLFVRFDRRGTRAGRALAERLVDEAKRAGHTTMVLDTLETMAPARALYRSLGFVETDAYYANPLPGVVFMRLAL